MIRSHSEMAHILGLQDNPLMLVSKNTGWRPPLALNSLQSRYKDLKPNPDSNLNFGLVSADSSQTIAKAISNMSHGDYVGFASGWWTLDFSRFISGKGLRSGHAYSLHAVKEGEKTHFIYVNRGQRHYDMGGSKEDENADAVMVFSVDNNDAEGFARKMMDAAKSFNPRINMSKFLHQHQDKINPDLSKLLGKKDQKTGNCTVANSNIAWHFQLASDAMRQSAGDDSEHLKSFADAYAETKSIYKQMRVNDRVEAFKYLLNDKSSYLSNGAYFYNCMQALEKFAIKDQKKNANHIRSLVNSANKETLNNLINLLVSHDFAKNIEQYIDERIKTMQKSDPNISNEYIQLYREITTNNLYKAKDMVLSHALKKAPEETQKNSINNDISLLRHAAPNIQEFFLKQNFNQYALYASEEVKKIFPIYQPKDVANEVDLEKFYLNQSTNTSRERKTSTNRLLLNSAGLKEIDINNKLRSLYSYAAANEWENVDKAFEDLCLICCKRRFYLTGGAYSADTRSAHWLIDKLSADDETGKVLRSMLNINIGDIKGKVDGIIASKNTKLIAQSADYKNHYHEHMSTARPDTSKVTAEDNLTEEKTVVRNPRP